MTVLEITPAVRTAKRKWIVPRTLCVIYFPLFFSQDSVFSLLSFLPFSLFFLLFLCSFLFRFFFLCPSFHPSLPPLSLSFSFWLSPHSFWPSCSSSRAPLFALGRTANVLLWALFPLRVPVPSPGPLAVHSWSRVAGEAAAWASGEAAGPSQVTLASDLFVNPTASEFKKWVLSFNLNCCLLLCLSVAWSPGLGRNSVYLCVSLHRGGNSGAEEGFYSHLNSRGKHEQVKDKFQWCYGNRTIGKSWSKSCNLFLGVCRGGPVWGQNYKSR